MFCPKLHGLQLSKGFLLFFFCLRPFFLLGLVRAGIVAGFFYFFEVVYSKCLKACYWRFLLHIYDFLENPLHCIAFSMTCTQLRNLIASCKSKPATGFLMNQPGMYIAHPTSVAFFEWTRTFYFGWNLEHLAESDNLPLIQYAVENLAGNLRKKSITFPSRCLQLHTFETNWATGRQ